MPTLLSVKLTTAESVEEIEEARIASLSSSPSRHSGSLPCSGARGPGRMLSFAFGHRNRESTSSDGHHCSASSGCDSTTVSQQGSPWASTAATPLSTPGTTTPHVDFNPDLLSANRTPEKKRLSWLGSTPASHWTMHRTPCNESSSQPMNRTNRSTQLPSRTTSWSSLSTGQTQQGSNCKTNGSTTGSKREDPKKTSEGSTASLVPNAQFLGLLLLMILLISSPLIKILSVLLFVAVVVLDDA